MALERQEYPAALATLSPTQAVDVLTERVRTINLVNTGMADWLKERKAIEEQYASSLRRLSRRAPPTEPEDFGIFATPWSALISNMNSVADTHGKMAAKIESDLEKPLRNFAAINTEMKTMANMQGNLNALARDVDNAQRRVEKAGGKGGAPQKLASANTELETARAQWESQAPFVFESLQAMDESRTNNLRDTLTQLLTHEVDKIERDRLAAEQCLNVLLTVDTADEIKMFSLRAASDRPPIAPRAVHSQATASYAISAPSTPGPADDRASQHSDSVPDLPTPKSDKPRGLRRLGTVLSRRRESKVPAGGSRLSESPERTPDRRASRLPASSTFANFGRTRSRDETLQTPKEEPEERPRSPLRTMSSVSDALHGNETQSRANGLGNIPNLTNGGHQDDLAGLSVEETPSKPAEMPASSERVETTETEPINAPALDPITQAEREAAQESLAPAFKVDIKDAPTITDSGNDDLLANMASALKLQGPASAGPRRQGTARGRRDNRASIYDSLPSQDIQSFETKAPIAEEPRSPVAEESQNVSGATSQPLWAPVPLLQPEPLQNLGVQAPMASPFPPQVARGQSPLSALRPLSAQREDAGSIRSGRSQGSAVSASHRHPEVTEPGLNSSIIETVSATFEGGKITRSVIVGEVALINNDEIAAHPTQTLRLASLTLLDKIAPNPAFISNEYGSVGQYTLDLSQLGKGKAQVAFKYQLSGPSILSGSLAPLALHPQWKTEPTQTSVILSYSLSPAFVLGSGRSVSLKDVTLFLHLGDGPRANSCLSKPVGTFNKERGVLYWSLGDLTLTEGQPSAKLLARFQTDGEARPGRAEARWVLEGSGSDAAIEVKGIKEEDPFSDGEATETWTRVEGAAARKRLVAGSYVGV